MNLTSFLEDNELGDFRCNKANINKHIISTSYYRRIGCIADGSCFFHAICKGLSEIYQLSYKKFKNISEATIKNFETSVLNKIIFPSSLFTEKRTNDLNNIYYFNETNGFAQFMDLMTEFRKIYVKILRQDFAHKILNDSLMKKFVKTRLSGYIDLLIDSGDNLGNILNYDQAFNNLLQDLSEQLLSNNPVQPDFILLLSDFLDIDIYLLRDKDLIDPNPKNTPLYSGSSLHSCIHGPINMRSSKDIYINYPNRQAIVIISIDDLHYEIVGRVNETKTEHGIYRQINTIMNQEEPLIKCLYELLNNLRNFI